MASFPQCYDDFTFSGEDSSQFLNPLDGLESYVDSSAAFPHDVSTNPTSFDGLYGSFGLYQTDVSPATAILLPERFGISDMAVPEFNNNMGACCYNHLNHTTQYYHNGEECTTFSPELKPFTGDQYWGIEGEKQVPAMEETNTKIGRYSIEERKDRIMRYLKKKNQRNFNKTIKYVCRKTLADRRVRIRGRFARNNETYEQQQSPSKNLNNTEKVEIYSGDDYLLQMEQDDSWLQEAMSDIGYFPTESYVAGDNHEKTWSF